VFLVIFIIPLLIHYLRSPSYKKNIIDLLMLFATLWAFLSIAISAGRTSPIEPIGIFGAEFFGAYLVGRVAVRSADDFRRYVRALLVILLFLIPLAAFESITRQPIALNLIPNSFVPSDADPRLGLRRAQVVFAHPILFGVFASSCFGLMLFTLSKKANALGSLLSLIGSFFSLSTGAVVSVVFQTILFCWEHILRRLRKRWLIFAIGCVTLYISIDLLSNRTPFHVLITYGTFSMSTGYGRILIFQYGFENVLENPLFGLGLNNSAWKRPAYLGASLDNFWLYHALTYGVPMFIAFAGAIIWTLWKQFRSVPGNSYARQCRKGYMVALAGIIVAGGTVHYWHSMLSFVIFLFGSGIWMLNIPTEETEQTDDADILEVKRRYTRFSHRNTT